MKSRWEAGTWEWVGTRALAVYTYMYYANKVEYFCIGRFCHNLPWLWKIKSLDKSYLITLCKNRHLEVSLPERIIQIDQVLTKLCMFRFDAYFLFKWNEKVQLNIYGLYSFTRNILNNYFEISKIWYVRSHSQLTPM